MLWAGMLTHFVCCWLAVASWVITLNAHLGTLVCRLFCLVEDTVFSSVSCQYMHYFIIILILH